MKQTLTELRLEKVAVAQKRYKSKSTMNPTKQFSRDPSIQKLPLGHQIYSPAETTRIQNASQSSQQVLLSRRQSNLSHFATPQKSRMPSFLLSEKDDESIELAKASATRNREWMSLLANTPLNQPGVFNKKALKLLAKDANTVLKEHRTHQKPYYRQD